MSDISKAELRDEIAELCESQDKPLPDNFERLNLVSLFNAFEDLAGSPHPKRPVPGVGAVRASSAPPAPPADEAPAAVVEAPAPVVEEPSAPVVEEPSAPVVEEPSAPAPAFAFDDPPAAPAPKGARVSASGRYIVAEGHMVVCKKGKIGAFQEIRALDLADGEEGLDALFADGSVVAAKR